MTRRLAILILTAIVIGIPLFSLTRGTLLDQEPTTAVAATLSPTEQLIESLWAQVRILQAILAELLRVRGLTVAPAVPIAPTVGVPVAGTPVSPLPVGPCPALITRYLLVGSADAMTGFEVTKLQQFLTRQGVYTGPVTGYFGPLTEAGLKRFQINQLLVTTGTAATTGFGATWPKTRERINVLNCGTVPVATGQTVVGSAISGGGATGQSTIGTQTITLPPIIIPPTGGGEPPTLGDVCPNLTGAQLAVPSGYVLSGGNCIIPPPTVTDICPNLSGVQTTIPSGYILISSGNCVTTPPPTGGGGGGLLSHLTDPDSGWTEFNLPSNNKIIYVSQTDGNDSCNGLSSTLFAAGNTVNCPKRTLVGAKNTLPMDQPGWLLLKRGDSWPTESLGIEHFTSGTNSEVRLIASYGASGARPVINSINMPKNAPVNTWDAKNNVAFVGLHIKRQNDSNAQGLRWVGSGKNILVEDCYIEKGIVFQKPSGWPLDNIKIRRNVIVDNIAPSGNLHNGIFMEGANGILIEENILDRNGYDTTDFKILQSDTVIPYNLYIQNTNRNVVVRGNISMRSASSGVQMRAGGLLDNNLFIDNGIGVTMGATDSATNKITNNVVLAGKDILISGGGTRLCRAWGIGIDEAYSNPTEISDNIVAYSESAWRPSNTSVCPSIQSQGRPQGIFLSPTYRNVEINNNIVYQWEYPLVMTTNSTGPTAADGIRVKDNTFIYNKGVAGVPLVRIRTVGSYDVANAFDFRDNHYYDNSQNLDKWFNLSFESSNTPLVNTINNWSQVTGELGFSVTNPQLAGSKTIEDYGRSIGAGSTIADFAREARRQQKGFWRREYTASYANDYFRDAFRLVSRPEAVTITSTIIDLCPNLMGSQATLPNGYALEGGNCVSVTNDTGTNSNDNTGLVASWSFESVSNCSGTCPNLVSGKYGQAADFTGNEMINAGSPSSLDNLGSLTVSAWIKPRRAVAETFGGRIIDKRDQLGWAFFTVSGEAVRFHADFGNNTPLAVSTPGGSVPLDSWSHVAVVWTGGSSASDVTFYINGDAVSKTNITNPSGTRANDTNSRLLIGDNAAGEAGFDGLIDNLAIYDRALSESEIDQAMNDSLALRRLPPRLFYLANAFEGIWQLMLNWWQWLIGLFNL